jgi:uncharacterized protein involved in type VI secretion and phage assembly
MNLFDVMSEIDDRTPQTQRITGIVIGVVTNNNDDEGKMGRVKVRYPWLGKDHESNWARVAAPMAGEGRGIYFLPEVEDEVLVAFEHGDMRFPVVIGSLWNGKDAPPETNENGENNIRVIKSRSGHIIRLNDEKDKEKIEIIDKSEQNSIVFDTANDTITITTEKDITLSASKGKITLDAKEIEIKSSSGATTIKSGAGMDVEASGTMNIKGSTVNIN